MSGRGFSLVDTPRFFDGDLILRPKRTRTVLAPDDPRWRQLPQLAAYACWLKGLLGAALPGEAVTLAALELRREPEGLEDRLVDRLHADGSYLRSVYTVFGPATVYRDGREERAVPNGQTLLMTAMGRARAVRVPCTLHRRPGPGPERAVLVGSFEPRAARPWPSNVYRHDAACHSCAGS
jgi:hypothetical protein